MKKTRNLKLIWRNNITLSIKNHAKHIIWKIMTSLLKRSKAVQNRYEGCIKWKNSLYDQEKN